jgi:hypothetical protein
MERRHHAGLVTGLAFAATLLLAACSAATGAGSPSLTAPPAASGSPVPAASTTPTSGIRGKATAGPVCPVERVPADSACAPRPVIGAVIVVTDAGGKEVARATTGSDGTYLVTIPAGSYTVTPEMTTGIMRAPGPQSVTVTDGLAVVDLAYDTGIR